MNKTIQERYTLREIATGRYIDDLGYADVDIQDADWTTTKEKAEEWLSILDFPEDFEIVKIRVTCEEVEE